MRTSVSDWLVQRANQGDTAARDQILSEFRPLLRMAADRHVRQCFTRRFDASDVVQQTYLEAHKSFDTFRGTCCAELHFWMETILRRTVHSLYALHSKEQRDVRREVFEPHLNPELSFVWTSAGVNSPGPISAVIAGERALQVAAALDQLPRPFRIVVEKRFVDGLRLREIARQEETTIGTIAGRLRRGLECLQQHLSSEMQRELGINSRDTA